MAVRVVREHPPCLRLASDRRLRGVFWLAAGVVLLALFSSTLLGWFGVIAMSHGIGAMFATLVMLALGLLCVYAGLNARWGWCELEIADVAITVIDGLGWRIRHRARIDRPAPGVPLTIAVEHVGGGDSPPSYWLSVHNGEPHGQPVAIAARLDLPRAELEEIARMLERWSGHFSGRRTDS